MFIATTLDGYIATNEDSLEWLFEVEGEGDNGYSEFYEKVDTVVMGRRTYDWLMEQDLEEFPYIKKECYVFSRSLAGQKNEYVTYVDDDANAFVEQLRQKDGKNIWIVGGGALLEDFLQHKLIDELYITVAPVLLGGGIPLFQGEYGQQKLKLLGTRTFNQFVELHYEVKR